MFSFFKKSKPVSKTKSEIVYQPEYDHLLCMIAEELVAKNVEGLRVEVTKQFLSFRHQGRLTAVYREGEEITPSIWQDGCTQLTIPLSDPDSLDKLANWFHGLGLRFEAPTLAQA